MERFEKAKTAHGRRPMNSTMMSGADFKFDGDQLSLDSKSDHRNTANGTMVSLTKR